MGGGNTGAGASKHFVNVPRWDARTQAPFAGLVQKYSVQNWNAFRRVCHIVGITHSNRVPFSLHRKISGCFSRLTIFANHEDKLRFSSDCKPDRQIGLKAVADRRLRQMRGEKSFVTRQNNWAARASVHRLAFSRALGRK